MTGDNTNVNAYNVTNIITFKYNKELNKKFKSIEAIEDEYDKTVADIATNSEFYKKNKNLPKTWHGSIPDYKEVFNWMSGLVNAEKNPGEILAKFSQEELSLGLSSLEQARKKYSFREQTSAQMSSYIKALRAASEAKGQTKSEEEVAAAVNEQITSRQKRLDDLQESIENIRRQIKTLIESDTGDPRQTINYVDVLENTEQYTPEDNLSSNDSKRVEDIVSKVLSVITNIGIVTSVIMTAVLGIKYMIGSAEEKAEYKKDMVPYFVGAVLLFGICTIVKILQNFGQQINNS